MRLTKNTNQKIRTYCEGILDQLELVKCECTWKELFLKLEKCRTMQLSKSESIETLTVCDFCITKFQYKIRTSL
jgi:hypothetical protein